MGSVWKEKENGFDKEGELEIDGPAWSRRRQSGACAGWPYITRANLSVCVLLSVRIYIVVHCSFRCAVVMQELLSSP